MTDQIPEIEDRLRRALSTRADRVEPAAAGLDAIGSRAEAVRRSLARRRTLLSAAAVVAVAVAIAGGLAVADDNSDRTDLATESGDGSTTSRPVDDPSTIGGTIASPVDLAAAAAIWPLPSMSLVYTDPAVAALAFAQTYVGLAGEVCTRQPVLEGDVAFVDVVTGADVVDGACAGVSRNLQPVAHRTAVTLVRTELTWVVVRADSNSFSALDTSRLVIPTTPIGPTEIQPRAASSPLTVSVNWTPESTTELPEADRRIELRPLGSLEATNPNADVGDEAYVEVGLEAAPGTVVLLVTDGVTAIARPIRIDDPAVTATIIWPTPPVSFRFDDPAEAARVFANSYFSLGPPPLDSCSRTPVVDGNTATVGIVLNGVCGGVSSAAEPFGPTTTVSLVYTGVTWAVTGATSNRFTVSFGPAEMDRAPADGLPVPVSAFVTPTIDLDGPLSLELRRVENGEVVGFGSMPSGTEGERVQIPMGGAFEGTRVLVVQDGTTAAAILVRAPD